MLDITLTIDDLDLKSRLLTYSATREVTYRKVITTLNDTEHPYKGALRPIVQFSLMPGTDEEDAELYNTLEKLIFNVTYTYKGQDKIEKMRLVSNLESVFLLKSVDGKRRYKNGVIELRALNAFGGL